MFLIGGDPSVAHVAFNFNACQKFFYKNTPPEGISSRDYRGICQTYGGVSHYATLYDTSNRIPVFSAYKLELGVCINSANRRDTWFIEPMVSMGHFADLAQILN